MEESKSSFGLSTMVYLEKREKMLCHFAVWYGESQYRFNDIIITREKGNFALNTKAVLQEAFEEGYKAKAIVCIAEFKKIEETLYKMDQLDDNDEFSILKKMVAEALKEIKP